MKNILLLLSMTAIALTLYSCSDDKTTSTDNLIGIVDWEKRITADGPDYGLSIVSSGDGGFVITGSQAASDEVPSDLYLAKFDGDGNLLWEKVFGGARGESGQSVIRCADGGYAVAGLTYSSEAGGADVYLVKTDAGGNLQWEKSFGGENNDIGNDLVETPGGGLAVVGWTASFDVYGSAVYLVRTDAAGEKQWEKYYSTGGPSMGNAVGNRAYGGFVLAGQVTAENASKVYLIGTNQLGLLYWGRTFLDEGSNWIESLSPTTDGGFIMAGWAGGSGAEGYDLSLSKINDDGDRFWQKRFGGNGYDGAYDAIQIFDGGYVVVGFLGSGSEGGPNAYIARTDAGGNLIWELPFGDGLEECRGVIDDSDNDYGSFIIVGITYDADSGDPNIYLARIKEVDGNI
jgi:hypothetical protein